MNKDVKLLSKYFRHIQLGLTLSLCLFTQFASSDFPDLKLENIQIASLIPAGTATTYTIDLSNIGTVDVTGPITISVYLSEDSKWSYKDLLLNEIIEMGSTGTKTLAAELTIPDFRGGNFYLIFLVDHKQVIIESNETNNHLSMPVEIIGQEGNAPCSFIKHFSTNFIYDQNDPPTVIEYSDGYDIRIPSGNTFSDTNSVLKVLSTDSYGNELNFDTITTPKPEKPNLEINYDNGESEFDFQYYTIDGELVFEVTIPFNGNNEPTNLYNFFTKEIPFNDGYLIVGTYEFPLGTNGTGYEFFAIVTDNMGKVLTEDYYQQILHAQSVDEVLFADDGSIYLWTESLIDYDHIFKINPNGTIAYETGQIAGGTGSWLQEVRLSPNGDNIWGRIGSNSGDKIVRVDTESGATTTAFLSDILSADSPPGDDFFTGLNFDKNGNVLIGYRFKEWTNDPFIGFEFGLMNPNFELIWENRMTNLSQYPVLNALGEVSNGFMFLASRLTEPGGILIKLDADGNLTEDCEDEGACIDVDNDGVCVDEDCDDNNALVNPNATEVPYNGIDEDCNQNTLDDDLDKDGFVLADDCDDTNASINPDATEVPYNGVDDDCNQNTLDDDLDQDGFVLAEDCDDTNASINPDATEVPYNGIDDDCNQNTLDDDLDQDGFVSADDCDDTNAGINPDATEIPDNGIDEDCDGEDLMTSTHNIHNIEITVYPNPVVARLFLDIKGHLEYNVRLYNLKGQLVFLGDNIRSLSTENLTNGTYILKFQEVRTGDHFIERIIISK